MTRATHTHDTAGEGAGTLHSGSAHTRRTARMLALGALVLLLAGCGTGGTSTAVSTPTSTAVSTPMATATAANSATPATGNYPIKVYFSKFPETSLTAVYPVQRTSPTIAVATFAVQMLIAGPTPEERARGYFSELNSVLTGPSVCSAPYPTGGPDFTLTLNMKGTTAQQGTATLRFCRATALPGEGTDARILAELRATLTQFPTITSVVILTKDGHCFGDLSGMDLCLK